MKRFIVFIVILGITSAYAEKVTSLKGVAVDKDGNARQVYSRNSGTPKTLKENQYSLSVWTSFNITNDVSGVYPYIIKDGNVWRDMNQAEKDAADAKTQQEVTEETTSDPQLDAILHTIAKAIDGNVKTYDGVKALFEGSVDPEKAKKKEKSK